MAMLTGLVSVFLGALLAFVVDHVRERRTNAAWVRRYFGAIRETLAASLTLAPEAHATLRTTQGAVAALLEGLPLDEAGWAALEGVPIVTAPDLLGPLRGGALSVVAPDDLLALTAVEASTAELAQRSRQLEALHDRVVLPLVLGRPDRLAEEQCRGLRLFDSRLAEFLAGVDAAAEAVGAAVDRLSRR